MMNNPYEQERESLICLLTKALPYPRTWFEQRTTAQLIAMYKKGGKKHPENIAQDTKSAQTRINESGEEEILTDAGNWELVQ